MQPRQPVEHPEQPLEHPAQAPVHTPVQPLEQVPPHDEQLEPQPEQPLHPVQVVLHPLHPLHPDTQALPQPPVQVPVHPIHLLKHVPTHNPEHAPRQDELAPSKGSVDRESTYGISVELKSEGILSPLTTLTRLPLSLTVSSKSTVFCPCSAKIGLPVLGGEVKS